MAQPVRAVPPALAGIEVGRKASHTWPLGQATLPAVTQESPQKPLVPVFDKQRHALPVTGCVQP